MVFRNEPYHLYYEKFFITSYVYVGKSLISWFSWFLLYWFLLHWTYLYILVRLCSMFCYNLLFFIFVVTTNHVCKVFYWNFFETDFFRYNNSSSTRWNKHNCLIIWLKKFDSIPKMHKLLHVPYMHSAKTSFVIINLLLLQTLQCFYYQFQSFNWKD